MSGVEQAESPCSLERPNWWAGEPLSGRTFRYCFSFKIFIVFVLFVRLLLHPDVRILRRCVTKFVWTLCWVLVTGSLWRFFMKILWGWTSYALTYLCLDVFRSEYLKAWTSLSHDRNLSRSCSLWLSVCHQALWVVWECFTAAPYAKWVNSLICWQLFFLSKILFRLHGGATALPAITHMISQFEAKVA